MSDDLLKTNDELCEIAKLIPDAKILSKEFIDKVNSGEFPFTFAQEKEVKK